MLSSIRREVELKEDYDLTAQHLAKHGVVTRANRLFVKALHRVNPGGAVAVRTSKKEDWHIKLLRQKWPGVFLNHRRKNEVMMRWKGYEKMSEPEAKKKSTSASKKRRSVSTRDRKNKSAETPNQVPNRERSFHRKRQKNAAKG